MIVPLPEELTIARAAEIKDLLLSALRADEPLELDGRAVAEVDAAGLQVLCAAGRSARRQGKTVTFVAGGRSPTLAQAIDLAGLGQDADAWLCGEAGGA